MTAAATPELVLRSPARCGSGFAPAMARSPLAPIGTVSILWKTWMARAAARTEAATILDEIARLGYDGCHRPRIPRGRRAARGSRRPRTAMAEVYAALR